MDYDTVEPEIFGASLQGIGLNILVKDVLAQCEFLERVFAMKAHQKSKDFAIITTGQNQLQLHSDATYHSNPLLSLLPELPPSGAGIEIRLYDIDPDMASEKAKSIDATVLQEPTDKEHGLREAYILCENGYAWVPSKPIDD